MNCLVVVAAFACLAQSALSGHVGLYPGAYVPGAVPYSGSYAGPLASPVVLPSGYLADTHEVAALKGAHAVALTKAGAAAAAAPADGYGYYGVAGGTYAGPLAVPVVLPSGYLADTHEVAALKGAHAVALNKAAAAAVAAPEYGYGYGVAGARYAGPLAVPVVLPSGYLADTHEVAALKGAHAVAQAKAGAAAAAAPEHGYYH